MMDSLSLNRSWTFYIHSKDGNKKYIDNLIKIIDIDTVQLFWQTYNNIPSVINIFSNYGINKLLRFKAVDSEESVFIPSAYSFFEKDILPTWEHTRLGAELSIRENNLQSLEQLWKTILVSIISESYMYSSDISGVRVIDSSYNDINNYRIELWINNLDNINSHKKYLIDTLALSKKTKFLFREHSEINES